MKFFSLILLFFSVSALPLVRRIPLTSRTPTIEEAYHLALMQGKVNKIAENVVPSYLEANSEPFSSANGNPKKSLELIEQIVKKLIVTSEIGSGLNRPLLPVAFPPAAAA